MIDPLSAYVEAARAVFAEHRDAVKARRLVCVAAVAVSERTGVSLMRLTVGSSTAYDWTWEGSLALRPLLLSAGTEATLNELLWCGEIVDVDPVAGHLYVTFDEASEISPRMLEGPFFVRPFPFLESLKRFFELPRLEPMRLEAAERLLLTSTGPRPSPKTREDPIEDVFARRWGVLWGPPGTGKTYTLGHEVARCLIHESRRLLVVSTTNKATDGAALSIGRALITAGREDLLSTVTRVGKGGHREAFVSAGLARILEGAETDALHQLQQLKSRAASAPTPEARARLMAEINDVRRQLTNGTITAALDPRRRVLISTAFNALRLLLSEDHLQAMERGATLFDTVILDEAGLLSRAVTAALSFFGGRGVVLVGDPLQLAPISKMARVLPMALARWLRSSGLTFLDPAAPLPDGVVALTQQHRMHADVRQVVSAYQYRDRLEDGANAPTGPLPDEPPWQNAARATWIVLDEMTERRHELRADRGPGNHSWIRPLGLTIFARLLEGSPAFKKGPGLFLTPFVAEGRAARSLLAKSGCDQWVASTIHAQQGAEARFVVIDTVNAGSHVWSIDEWQRLLNVAVSRAQEAVILLASRDEAKEPYLAPLVRLLAPMRLEKKGSQLSFVPVPMLHHFESPVQHVADATLLGAQIAYRKRLLPLTSRDQERLSQLSLDGKPRLVRGVAGSGKTVVLSRWLAQVVHRLLDPEARVWVLYANKALSGLLTEGVEQAFRDVGGTGPFPFDRVELIHIQNLLSELASAAGLSFSGFDYEEASRRLLALDPDPRPRCDALFVDEAQDLGHETLRMLTRLVRQSDPGDPNSRSFIVFYDNAQNLYARGTPRWSDFGLDMRGRSSVLKESFRATRPIAEWAFNVSYRLREERDDADHRELLERCLVEAVERNGRSYFKVRFNQVEGPTPALRVFPTLEREVAALTERVVHLVERQGVVPRDICILTMGRQCPDRVLASLARSLPSVGARVLHQRSESFTERADTVIMTTPHSFKGYDAEVVFIVGVDDFRSTKDGINASALYVAMTRARSVLEIFGAEQPEGTEGRRILDVLNEARRDLLASDEGTPDRLRLDDLESVLEVIGEEHRHWLIALFRRRVLRTVPLLTSDGQNLGAPLFVCETATHRYACLDPSSEDRTHADLVADAGYTVLDPGDPVP